MPGGSGIVNTTGPILGTGKGQLRGFMPNIFSGFGGGIGGFLGGGYGAFDPTQRKRRPQMAGGAAPMPGAGAAPMPQGGTGILGPNPLKLNIYEQYPGINPNYRGDQLGGIEKERGMGDAGLQRLSEGAIAYRNRHAPMRGGVSGIGFGESMAPDPIKKLLMARYGGGI